MRLSQALLEAGVSLGSITASTASKIVLWGIETKRDSKSLYSTLLQAPDTYLVAPMEDLNFNKFIKYEAGTEEGVLALFSKALHELVGSEKPHIFEALDEGYISAECNVGEEEAESFVKWSKGKESVWVFGAEWETHPKAKLLAAWLAFISKTIPVNFIIVGVEAQMAASKVSPIPETNIELEGFDGTVMYACLALKEDEEKAIFASPQFAIAAKAKDGDKVRIQTAWGEYLRRLDVDKNMKGTIALLPFANLPSGYRYAKSRITLVG